MVVTSHNQLFETFLGSAFSDRQIVPWLLWWVQILFGTLLFFLCCLFPEASRLMLQSITVQMKQVGPQTLLRVWDVAVSDLGRVTNDPH